MVNINPKYIKITLTMKMVATPIKRKRTFIFLKNQDETIHCLNILEKRFLLYYLVDFLMFSNNINSLRSAKGSIITWLVNN